MKTLIQNVNCPFFVEEVIDVTQNPHGVIAIMKTIFSPKPYFVGYVASKFDLTPIEGGFHQWKSTIDECLSVVNSI